MRVEKQLSVFLENQPGTLAAMCDELAKADINILAMSVSDTADYAVVRLVVNNPDEALHLLGNAGTLVVDSEVAVIEIDNQVGGLGELARKLAKAGINIEYAYCTVAANQPKGTLILRTRDPRKAIKALSK